MDAAGFDPRPDEGSSRCRNWQDVWILNLVALAWGSTNAVMKAVIDGASATPPIMVAVRYWLAAVCVIPWLPCFGSAASDAARPALQHGAALAALWATSFTLGTAALQHTSANRATFVFYLNVKIVPILAYCFLSRKMTTTQWAMAALAATGTLLMCNDGSPPNFGDFLALANAVCGAVIILLTEHSVKYCAAEVLNATTTVTTMLFSTLLAIWDLAATARTAGTDHSDRDAAELLTVQLASLYPFWKHLLYLGIFCTAVTNWLQNVGQKGVPAERAAIIFAMDPVYGAFFAWILLDEHLGLRGLLGASLVSVAALTSARDAARDQQTGVAGRTPVQKTTPTAPT